MDLNGNVVQIDTTYIEASLVSDGTVCHADTYDVVNKIEDGKIISQDVYNSTAEPIPSGTSISDIVITIPEVAGGPAPSQPACLTKAEKQRLAALEEVKPEVTLKDLLAEQHNDHAYTMESTVNTETYIEVFGAPEADLESEGDEYGAEDDEASDAEYLTAVDDDSAAEDDDFEVEVEVVEVTTVIEETSEETVVEETTEETVVEEVVEEAVAAEETVEEIFEEVTEVTEVTEVVEVVEEAAAEAPAAEEVEAAPAEEAPAEEAPAAEEAASE